jgi:hypothetical protein
MALTFTIDQKALAIIVDGSVGQAIGTGFVFIQPNWVITAKHVVFLEALPRRELLASPYKGSSIRARVIFAHPIVDLAVLELTRRACDRPLFPAHHSLAGANSLVCAGYAPSKTAPDRSLTLFINEIPRFQIEIRERDGLNEELVVFDAPFSEGGHSGDLARAAALSEQSSRTFTSPSA